MLVDRVDVEHRVSPLVSEDVARRRIAAVAERAYDARRRAARAAAIAAELEAHCDRAPTAWRAGLTRLIRLHRSFEIRHLETARLHELYVSRLDNWSRWHGTATALPTFIAAVASAIGPKSAAVTLGAHGGAESLVAASDQTAQMAGDSEFVLGEGPAHDVAAWRVPVRAEGGALIDRWPRFGSAVAEHGVGSVIGQPLGHGSGSGWLGTLCVYELADTLPKGVAATSARVADALTYIVLNEAGTGSQASAAAMLDDDQLATLHQAAGVVSVQLSCRTEDAVALLRARAFTDGVPVEAVARRVITGDLQI
jgi:hypothetical protein